MAMIIKYITNKKGNKKGKELVKHYSDRGMYIERDGIEYVEAIDPIEFAEERIYIETDKPIESEEEVEEEIKE